MKSIVVKIIYTLLLVGVIIFVFQRGGFEKAELPFYNWRIEKYSASPLKIAPIVIVGITQNFENQIGEPFSRKFYIQLLDILEKEEAKVIGFDIYFPTITDKSVDTKFISAIKKSNKVVLPIFCPIKLKERRSIYYLAKETRSSHPEFNSAAISLGHINTLSDDDQIIRKIPAFIQHENEKYPQISLEMSRLYFEQEEILHTYSRKTKTSHNMIPLTKDGAIYMRMLSDKELVRYTISFEDVLQGKYPKDAFKNKAVFIGQTIVGAKNADLVPTPLGTKFGVLLQASCLHNAITGEFIQRLDKKTISILLLLWGVLMAFTIFSPSFSFNTFLLLFFTGSITYFSFYKMRSSGLFLDTIPFLVLSFTTYFSSLLHSLFTSIKKVIQKEGALKIMHNAEKEIMHILTPVELVGNKGETDFSQFKEDTLIKQTPEIALKTILTSIGIEFGAILTAYSNNKYQVITEEGNFTSKTEVAKLIKASLEKKEPYLVNKISSSNPLKEYGIRNILILPAISHPSLKVLGVFINKRYSPFSKNSFFSKEDIPIINSLTLQALIAIQNAMLNISLKDTQLESILRLSAAIEYRDRETGMHIHRVSEYAGIVAENIGLHKNEIELIKNAMPLHDIGKIAIPDKILLKPGKLTPEEREVVKQHPLLGAEILKGSKSLILKASEIIALYHHEKYDGTGYPFGLKGKSIPLYGRIASIADIFDALSSKRVYKEAMGFEESKSLLLDEAGTTFDPHLVNSFLKEEDRIKIIMETYKEVSDISGAEYE